MALQNIEIILYFSVEAGPYGVLTFMLCLLCALHGAGCFHGISFYHVGSISHELSRC